MNFRNIFIFLFVAVTILSACYPVNVQLTPSAVSIQQPVTTITQISEESLIGTEQAMAMTVQAEGALTRAAQPTQTSILAHLPTLTPIPNSTPAHTGAFFDVAPDVLGSRYEIKNACYFDTQSGWERYEIYAGAIAGSGDEYSAHGVVVVRILQVTEKAGKPFVEIVDAKEYLTTQGRGPLYLSLWDECSDDWMFLRTPLKFGWILSPLDGEFYEDRHSVPLARIDSGGKTQLPRLKGDSSFFSTSPVPLTEEFPFTAHLSLPFEIPPDRLGLSAMLVSPPGKLEYDNASDDATKESVEWWADGQFRTPPAQREILDLGLLPLLSEQKISLSLEPGFYVLVVYATWLDVELYGHVGAEYEFLIEVR